MVQSFNLDGKTVFDVDAINNMERSMGSDGSGNTSLASWLGDFFNTITFGLTDSIGMTTSTLRDESFKLAKDSIFNQMQTQAHQIKTFKSGEENLVNDFGTINTGILPDFNTQFHTNFNAGDLRDILTSANRLSDLGLSENKGKGTLVQ